MERHQPRQNSDTPPLRQALRHDLRWARLLPALATPWKRYPYAVTVY